MLKLDYWNDLDKGTRYDEAIACFLLHLMIPLVSRICFFAWKKYVLLALYIIEAILDE